MSRGIFHGYFKLRFKILDRDKFTCQYCGRSAPEVTLHVDHIVAVVDGGDDSDDNLTTSCSACNMGKEHLRLAVAGYRRSLSGRKKKPSLTQTVVYDKLKEIGQIGYRDLSKILRMNRNSIAVTLNRLQKQGMVVNEAGLWMISEHKLDEA